MSTEIVIEPVQQPVVCSLHLQVPDDAAVPDAKAILDTLKRAKTIPNDALINVSVQIVSTNQTVQTFPDPAAE